MRFQLAAVSGELRRLIYVLFSQCLLPEECPVQEDLFYLGIIQLLKKKAIPQSSLALKVWFFCLIFFEQTNLFTISLVLKQQ